MNTFDLRQAKAHQPVLDLAYGAAGDNQTPPRSSTAYRVSFADVTVPSQTIWVTDNNNAITVINTGGSQGFFWTNAAANPVITTTTSPRQLQNISERHLDFANAVFCDGHVKAMKLDDLARTKNLVDPVDGTTKNVLTLFTIEND